MFCTIFAAVTENESIQSIQTHTNKYNRHVIYVFAYVINACRPGSVSLLWPSFAPSYCNDTLGEKVRDGGREGLREKEEWCWRELRLWEGIRTSAAFPPLDVFFLSRCAFSPAGKERGKGAHANRNVSYAAAHALVLLFSLVLAFALSLQYRSLQPRTSDLHQ